MLEKVGFFIGGMLFASIGWGFFTMFLWHMYLNLEREVERLRQEKSKKHYKLL